MNEAGTLPSNKTPVVIYLHEFGYSKGFNSYHQVESLFQNIVAEGYAVFAFDMLGFGNRIEEGTRFYDRYPDWSKWASWLSMCGARRSAAQHGGIDPNRIYVSGYSLGAKVGLYVAAPDERIAGRHLRRRLTPMGSAPPRTASRESVPIRSPRPVPRFGFFVGDEARVPYDYHEVLACIASRPVLVVRRPWTKRLRSDVDIHQ